MEFQDMLKQGLNDVPGRGFHQNLHNQVLAAVAQRRLRRRRVVTPWSGVAVAAAVFVAAGAGWGLLGHGTKATAYPASVTTGSEQTSSPAGDATVTVSRSAGLGDTLAAMEAKYGKAVDEGVSVSGWHAYGFPDHHLKVDFDAGRVVSVTETFSQDTIHSAMQQFSVPLTPVDSTPPVTHSMSGHTSIFVYRSEALANALPKAEFAHAAPGTYSIIESDYSEDMVIQAVLGDATQASH